LYFVNHLLVFCFHRRRSLASFSCNCCLVQCVSFGEEFDDDDDDDYDGQDAGEDDDDDGGGDFDGEQYFIRALDACRNYLFFFFYWLWGLNFYVN